MKSFIRRQLKRLVFSNYTIAYNLEYLRYRIDRDLSVEPLIVYQMGKVGSSTIVKSLKQVPLEMDIFQVHVLTHEWIKKVNQQYREASRIHGRATVDEHMLASRYLRAQLDKHPSKFRWRVITIIRDAIARNISGFFQAFPIYFPSEAAYFKQVNIPLDERIPIFVDLFLKKFNRHNVPLDWFDMHMKPVFGIDVFSEPFKADKGFQIYYGNKADLLLLRLEDLNMSAAPAFKEFLGISNFELRDANISNQKNYASAYSKFKQSIVLPEIYVDSIYNSKYMRHFYTDEERSNFRKKWVHK